MRDQLLQLSRERHVPPYQVSILYNGLNELAEVLTWLDRGFDQRDPKMVFLKVDPRWKNLRGEPRYQSLLTNTDAVPALIRLRGRSGFCEQWFPSNTRPKAQESSARDKSVGVNAAVRLDEH
jgi:hypothetical protein